LIFTPAMLPNAEEWKKMANEQDVDPMPIVAICGALLAIAATIGAVFSFGASTPLVATGVTIVDTAITSMILSAAGSACILAAALGTGAVAGAIYEITDFKEGIDREMLRKNTVFALKDHTNASQKTASQELNSLLNLFFNTSSDNSYRTIPSNFGNGYFNAYTTGGRITAIEPEELDTKDK